MSRLPLTLTLLLLCFDSGAAFRATTARALPALRLRGGADATPQRSCHHHHVDHVISVLGRREEPAGLLRVGLFALYAYGWPLVRTHDGKVNTAWVSVGLAPWFFVMFLEARQCWPPQEEGWRRAFFLQPELTPIGRLIVTLSAGMLHATMLHARMSGRERYIPALAIGLTYLINLSLRARGRRGAMITLDRTLDTFRRLLDFIPFAICMFGAFNEIKTVPKVFWQMIEERSLAPLVKLPISVGIIVWFLIRANGLFWENNRDRLARSVRELETVFTILYVSAMLSWVVAANPLFHIHRT
jgi:hypothetical protein